MIVIGKYSLSDEVETHKRPSTGALVSCVIRLLQKALELVGSVRSTHDNIHMAEDVSDSDE